jgi:hypothetical protein
MSGQDSRRHARLNVWAEVHAAGPAGRSDGQLRNLSRRGASFIVPLRIVEAGELVELYFPRLDGPGFPIVGRVERLAVTSSGYEVAIHFDTDDAWMEHLVLGVIELLLRLPDEGERRHPRVIWRAAVAFRALGELRAVMEDISAGGLFLTVSRPFVCGEPIEVAVPDTAGHPLLLLRGQVVRASEAAIEGQLVHCVGVEFAPLSPEARRCVHELLRAVLDLTEEG